MSATPSGRERAPLLPPDRSSGNGYETLPLVPKGEGGQGHYNLAGLDQRTFWVLMCSMYSVSFLAAFDGTIVSTLLGPISSSFLATNLASWLGTSYMLTTCCFTPIYGRLCNIMGRQTTLLMALTIFATGNALCGFAPNMWFMISARALAGFGGGGLAVISSTVSSDLVPLSHRGLFQGYANICFGAGMAFGPPIGGWINDTFGWRWAFYAQLPCFIVAWLLIWKNLRYHVSPSGVVSVTATPTDLAAEKQSPLQALGRIDWAGCILLAGWLGTALIAVSLVTNSTADASLKWTDPLIIDMFAGSAVLLIAFLLVELKYAAEPVMPFELLTSRTPVSVAINNLLISILLYASLYTNPLFLTVVRQLSASAAGSRLVPQSFAATMASIASGIYVRKYGKYKWLTIFTALGGIVSPVLNLTWSTTSPDHVFWWAGMPQLIMGGAVTTLTVVALIADVGREQVAVATSLSYCFRTTGQVLGVSLSGALTQAVLQTQLTKRITGPDAAEIIERIRQSSASIRDLPLITKTAAILSYEHALRAVFVMNLVVGVLAFLVLFGIKEKGFGVGTESKPKVIQADEEEEEEEEEEEGV